MLITDTLARQAEAAVKFPPVPPAKPKDYRRYGATRDEWRKHQADRHLPTGKFILKDGLHGWSQSGSPFEPGGGLKPPHDLRELGRKLAGYREKVWLVLGEEQNGGGHEIIGVVLGGTSAPTPYLFVAADRPGQKVTVEDGKVRFEGAKLIGGLSGNFTEGDTLPLERMPKVTLRTHDRGGALAVKCSDPGTVEVKGDGFEVEKARPPVRVAKERGR